MPTPSPSGSPSSKPPRPVSGRMVLVTLLAFFGVVFAVNAYMAYAAIHTFGGVETDSAYKVGLAYDSEIAAAEAQQGRAWQVEAALSGNDAGRALQVSVRGGGGAPEAGLAAHVKLIHPGNRQLDIAVPLTEVSPGVLRGVYAAPAGQRELVIELFRGGARMFRSQNRVSLK
ncbi:MAG: nitrogen fixation protein FixH [Xanthobacteraceae bacterium]|nr:MAG: nitrogen fixation protein FixH [Xanthobacteraceae bacterium]